MIAAVLARPVMTLLFAGVVLTATLWPVARLGSEFMPPLDEGDLLYMPTALPGLAVGKASEILQQTDRILKTFPGSADACSARWAAPNPPPIRRRSR